MESIINNLPKDDSQEVSPLFDNNYACENVNRPKGYSHDNTIVTGYPDWQKSLSDNIRLSEMSLPGTHDTMSFYGGDIVQCQSLSLANQLCSGIRVLDIRCKHVSDIFAIYHGIISQNAHFGDVLNTVIRFLKDYPTETIYMRVKEEDKPSKTTRSFEDTFRIGY